MDQNDDLVIEGDVTLSQDGAADIKQTLGKNKNPLFFVRLVPGKMLLVISAAGFDTFSKEINLDPGRNEFTAKLSVKNVFAEVDIKRDPQAKSVDDAFSGFLTRDEINALPDTPEGIRRALKDRFGEDVIIRVDGFSDRIPPKEAIASIRATLTSYDAANHELGFAYVDITTKVIDQSFTGTLVMTFNDSSFNARDPFSLSRLPAQEKDFSFFLFGPIVKKKTSFQLFANAGRNNQKENIIAIIPNETVEESAVTTTAYSSLNFKVNQNLPNDHIGRLQYRFSESDSNNLGIGGFNLTERGFSRKSEDHTLRLSETGYIGGRFFNEFKLEYDFSKSRTTPNANTAGRIVPDAFSAGGAGNEGKSVRKTLWFEDNFLVGLKKHTLKFGGLFRYEAYEDRTGSNNNGTFLFASLQDYISGTPSLFTRTPGTRDVDVSQIQFGTYIQHDYRIKKGLGLGFGLRYEFQNNLDDSNNFSPRFGFTWSPHKSGRVVFRGGVGLFYNWLESGVLGNILSLDFSRPGEIVISNPGYPDPLRGRELLRQTLPVSFRQKAEDLTNPYVIHTSFGAESRLSRKLRLRTNYVYQKGLHQFRSRNLNAPVSGFRPDNNFGNILNLESSGYFVRNSLDMGLSGLLRKGVSFGVNYTLARKTSDINGVFDLPSDNLNLRLDRGPTGDDQRHRLNTSVNWKIRRGLLISAIHRVNSPLAYTITTGFDNNGDTVFNDRPPGIARNSERGEWRSQFDAGMSWHFSFWKHKGNKKGLSTIVYTPSEITRDNESTESGKLFSMRLFVSVRNVFNQTNFNRFTGVSTSPLFRQPVSADQARKMEVGLYFNF